MAYARSSSAARCGGTVVPPGTGVRTGNVKFLALSEHSPRFNLSATAGTFVLVPPGVLHTFANRTTELVRILNVHAPAGFDHRLLGD